MTKEPTAADIEALVQSFDDSDWQELHILSPGFELFLSKTAGRMPAPAAPPAAGSAATIPAPTLAPASAPSGAPTASGRPANWVAVAAPNLGTFYRSTKPGDPPFVQPGDSVRASDQVCLLEVMKLFTGVVAGVSGIVREVCADDGAMVEHGQALFYIEVPA